MFFLVFLLIIFVFLKLSIHSALKRAVSLLNIVVCIIKLFGPYTAMSACVILKAPPPPPKILLRAGEQGGGKAAMLCVHR